jgi:Phosphotransferase enzyme family
VDGQAATASGAAWHDLTPRTLASSVDELVAGATHREPFRTSDAKSGSRFERLVIDGERYVLKTMHVDDDWIARSLGDVTCWPVAVWASGLLDAIPASIDHAVAGATAGLGRHGWGAALLMRDVGDRLVPPGDATIPLGRHAGFVADLAALSARFWGWRDAIGLLQPSMRWTFFGPGMIEVERDRGWPDAVPEIAARGWHDFAARAPADVATLVGELRSTPWAISEAVAATPSTLLHGDWKLGNVGSQPDGRTILIDWACPGEGPACHDLAWYLAINRARLPESKEDAIARFRADLERNGIATAGWWDPQLGLCLLGAVVQFGWEKALGDADELGWWLDRAREGAAWL